MIEPGPHRHEPLTAGNGSHVASQSDEHQKHIRGLLSDDFLVRSDTVTELAKLGEDAAKSLVSALLGKSFPPHAVPTFSEALERIGKPAIQPLLDALDGMPVPQTSEEAFRLESLIEILTTIKDRRTVQPLIDQIKKLNKAIRRNGNRVLVDACESSRVLIHRILSGLGERAALHDLLSMLGDGRKRVRDGIVQALARIGDRRALVPLLRLHLIESSISSAGDQAIRETFRDILRREHVAVDDPLFKNLKAGEREALDRLIPKSKNGNGNGGRPPVKLSAGR